MLTNEHLFPILFYFAGALLLTMALLALSKKPRRLTLPFALTALLTALWSFIYALEITTPDLAAKLSFVKIEYLAVATIPTLWLIVAIQYTGHTLRFDKRILTLLLLEPTITILLAWTDARHHLIYAEILLVKFGKFILLDVIYGPWFWIHIAYSYILMTAVVALIWDQYHNSGKEGKKQALFLLVASLIPWVSNFIIAEIWVTPHIELSPILLTAGYLVAMIGIVRAQKINIAPIARNVTVEEMSDAYLVLDNDLRIIDVNMAAEKSFGLPKSKLIGELLSEVTPPTVPLEDLIALSLPFRQIIEMPEAFFDVRAESMNRNGGRRAGILAIWRDVTASITQKRLLEEKISQLNSVNYVIETINKATTLQEVYDAAMQSIRETLHTDKTSILLFDQDGVMKFVTWRDLSEKYRKMTEGHSPWTPHAVNPQPIFVADIEKTDDPSLLKLKEVILEEGVRALGFIPIVHQGRLLGKFMIYYSTPHDFTKRESELGESIAGHLAITIEKARLLEQAQKRLRRIDILQKIDVAISATLDLDHQIDILLSHVINELQSDISVLFLVDKATRKIAPASAKGSYNPLIQKDLSFEIGEGGVGWIVLHKKPLYIPDISQNALWKNTESSAIDRIVSYLGIPLMVDGEVIGVLDISNRYFREYTEEEIDFLQTLAGQAAIAIKNARLYQELQKKVSQLEAVHDISKELMAEHDTNVLLQKIVTKATELLDASNGMIFLYDEERKLLTVAADNVNLGQPMLLGEGLAGRVAQTRRPMIIDNYSQWEHRSLKYEDTPITSIIETPMMHGGKMIGVLVVYELERGGKKFVDEDARLLSLLASQAASAVFNAQLIERLQQRIKRLQALYQISAEISKLKDAQASCRSVTRLIYEKLEYDYVYVILVNKNTQEREVVDCRGSGCQRMGERIPRGRGLIERTIRDRKLHYWPDISQEADYYPGCREAKCEVDVPIQSRERLFGVLIVENDEIDAFDQEDFDMLQTVANQLAVALENAQRMDDLSSLLLATTKLYQASHAIGKAKTVVETIKVSVRSLKSASDADIVLIHIFENDRRMTYGIDRYGNDLIDMDNEGLSSEASDALANIRINTILERDQLPEALRLQNVSQAMAFPLQRGTNAIGVILMLYADDVHISPREMELLAIYANQTTIAIEKAISMEDVSRRALEQEVVSSIARSLNETLDVEKAFPQLAGGIRKLVAADRVSVALPDEEWKRFTLSVIYDAGDRVMDGQWSPLEFTAALADVEHGNVHITPDLSKEKKSPVEDILDRAGYRSRINIPLMAGDEVLGALNIMSFNINEFTPENLPPLLQIADALAISIANTLSIKQERKLAQEITLLYSLSRRLSSLNTIEEVVNATAEIMTDTLDDLIHTKVILAGNQFQSYVIPRTIVGSYHAWVKDIHAYPAIVRALDSETDCSRISRDDAELARFEKELIFTRNGRFVWLFPLTQGDEALGVLIMERDKQNCSDSELRRVKSIAELLLMTLHRVLLFHEVEGAYLNAVLALALASDAKDSYTADHSQRLESLAVAVAEEMGLDRQKIENLRFGARLHDIGKIGVPDNILKKPGPLTGEEWKSMREHPEIGERILSPLPRLREAAKIVRHHHERYDGKGYPDQLKGEEIPIGARILTVVDAYGAITDKRVYKSKRSHQEAIAELRKNAGTQFDPEVVTVFLKLFGDSPPYPTTLLKKDDQGDSSYRDSHQNGAFQYTFTPQ